MQAGSSMTKFHGGGGKLGEPYCFVDDNQIRKCF